MSKAQHKQIEGPRSIADKMLIECAPKSDSKGRAFRTSDGLTVREYMPHQPPVADTQPMSVEKSDPDE